MWEQKRSVAHETKFYRFCCLPAQDGMKLACMERWRALRTMIRGSGGNDDIMFRRCRWPRLAHMPLGADEKACGRGQHTGLARETSWHGMVNCNRTPGWPCQTLAMFGQVQNGADSAGRGKAFEYSARPIFLSVIMCSAVDP
jgi:hypothetical protein